MKKKFLNRKTSAFFSILFMIGGLTACGGSDNDGGGSSGTDDDNPNPNPTAKFDKNDFKVTMLPSDPYEPGDDRLYVHYRVTNLNKTKAYNINDNEWDILFKVKATDGYEFSNNVNVLSLEPEDTYEHGLPIPASTGKTLNLSTLTYEIIPSMD